MIYYYIHLETVQCTRFLMIFTILNTYVLHFKHFKIKKIKYNFKMIIILLYFINFVILLNTVSLSITIEFNNNIKYYLDLQVYLHSINIPF